MTAFERDEIVGYQIRDQIYCTTCMHNHDRVEQIKAENLITLADEEVIAFCDECDEWL